MRASNDDEFKRRCEETMQDLHTRMTRLEQDMRHNAFRSESSRSSDHAALLDFVESDANDVGSIRSDEAVPAAAGEPHAAESEPPEMVCGEGLKCRGCFSFRCLLFVHKAERVTFIDMLRMLSASPSVLGNPQFCFNSYEATLRRNFARWVTAHRLVTAVPPSCPKCEIAMNPTLTSTRVTFRCPSPSCRHQESPEQLHKLPQFLLFIADYLVVKRRLRRAADDLVDCGALRVREWIDELANLTTLFTATCVDAVRLDDVQGWWQLEWDETFYSKRKYMRGARVREAGTLTYGGGVHYITAANGHKKVIDTIIAAAASKSARHILPLLIAHAEPGAFVETDGARMYKGLAALGFTHEFINHKHEFVSESGTHTNSVEGFWHLIKSTAKDLWGRQPADKTRTATNFQLCNFIVNCNVKKIALLPAFAVLLRWRAAIVLHRDDTKTLEILYSAARNMLANHDVPDREEPFQSDDSESIEDAVDLEEEPTPPSPNKDDAHKGDPEMPHDGRGG
jgi:hypothetical protein